MKHFVMCVFANRRLKSVDFYINSGEPSAQELSSADYTRTLVSGDTRIHVIGVGKVLAPKVLAAFAQTFMRGEWTKLAGSGSGTTMKVQV